MLVIQLQKGPQPRPSLLVLATGTQAPERGDRTEQLFLKRRGQPERLSEDRELKRMSGTLKRYHTKSSPSTRIKEMNVFLTLSIKSSDLASLLFCAPAFLALWAGVLSPSSETLPAAALIARHTPEPIHLIGPLC